MTGPLSQAERVTVVVYLVNSKIQCNLTILRICKNNKTFKHFTLWCSHYPYSYSSIGCPFLSWRLWGCGSPRVHGVARPGGGPVGMTLWLACHMAPVTPVRPRDVSVYSGNRQTDTQTDWTKNITSSANAGGDDGSLTWWLLPRWFTVKLWHVSCKNILSHKTIAIYWTE